MRSFPINDLILENSVKGIELSPLIPVRDYFNYLIKSVVYQQLSGKSAAAIYGRFTDLFPLGISSAELIRKHDVQEFKHVGLSAQKASYIFNIAEFSLKNNMSDAYLNSLSDEEVIKYLTQIKGVGKWTAEMLLIFAMCRPDIFPLDDYGIMSGIEKMYSLSSALSLREKKMKMLEISEKWKPSRSLATRYIWAWKDSYRKLTV